MNDEYMPFSNKKKKKSEGALHLAYFLGAQEKDNILPRLSNYEMAKNLCVCILSGDVI